MDQTKLVGEDRDNDSLSNFSEDLNARIVEYSNAHPNAQLMFIGCDENGFVMSGCIDKPVVMAHAIDEICHKHEMLVEVMKEYFSLIFSTQE